MSKIRLYGDTSGYVDVAAPATADNSTLDLSTVAKTNSANTFTDTLEVYKAGTAEVLIGSDNGGTAQLSFYEANTSTKEAFIKYDGLANTFNLGTSGSGNAISIGRDTGHVTMPYQPMASATWSNQGTTGVVPANGGFGSNVGNHLSTGGRFTCPVDGNYLILFTAMSAEGSQNLRVQTLINGSALGNEHIGGVGYTNSGTYSRVQIMTILTLNANDYIEINWQSGYSTLHQYHGNMSFALMG